MRRYLVLARFPDRVREAVATGVVGRGVSEASPSKAVVSPTLVSGSTERLMINRSVVAPGWCFEPTSSSQRFDGRRRGARRRW